MSASDGLVKKQNTSSAVWTYFSTSGNVVGDNRASLKPEKVNMLVFLAKNL